MGRPDQLTYFGALNALTANETSSHPSTSASASQNPTDASAPSGGVSGAVIGGAVGGTAALLAIIGVLVFFLCRRRRQRRRNRAVGSGDAGAHDGAAAMEQHKTAYVPASPQSGGLSRTLKLRFDSIHWHESIADTPP